MAQEHAADTDGPVTGAHYPDALACAESDLIRSRRAAAGLGDDELPPLGLALSGGGIRSATFCLGFLQALARRGLLKRIDYLSTVSGGGYIGSALGRLYARRFVDERTPPAEQIERALDASRPDIELLGSRPAGSSRQAEASRQQDASQRVDFVRWLRENGRYLTPNGAGDWLTGAAVFVRNWLTVHIVIASLLFAACCLIGVLAVLGELLPGLWRLDHAVVGLLAGSCPDTAPVPTCPPPLPWQPSALLALVTPLLLFGAIPFGWAYWMLSSERGAAVELDRIQVKVGLAVGAALLLFGSVRGLPLLASAGLHLLAIVLLATHHARAALAASVASAHDEDAVSTFDNANRQRVSRQLAVVFGVIGATLAAAVLDTLGATLAVALAQGSVGGALMALALGLTALVNHPASLLKALAPLRSVLGSQAAGGGALGRSVRRVLGGSLALAGYALFAVELIVIDAAVHGLVAGVDSRVAALLGLAALAAALAALLGHDRTLSFVNRSMLDALYSARLTRAYLGASNPVRHGRDQDVTEVCPDDDLALPDYRAAISAAGAPLHFINVTINETIDGRSQLVQHDRKGTILAVGPVALSVGVNHHALGVPGFHAGTDAVAAAVYPAEGGYRVFDGASDAAHWRPEALHLGAWTGLSGAAFGTGTGAGGSVGRSLLFGSINARLGRWWFSDLPQQSVGGLRGAFATVFPAQRYLLAEWLNRFPGTAEPYWFLSDGGHFENLGVYELLRRRLPLIIAIDAACDGSYAFGDLTDLLRKARIDFGADIRFLDPQQPGGWPEGLDHTALTGTDTAPGVIGSLEQLRAADSGCASRCAALATVTYDDGRGASLLLYVKATFPAGLLQDLRGYRALSIAEEGATSAFPQQSTGDQFFDEAQWESYRKLGEWIGLQVVDGTTQEIAGRREFVHGLRPTPSGAAGNPTGSEPASRPA